jgi:hypothetical protein
MVEPKLRAKREAQAAPSSLPTHNGYTFRFMCTVQGEGGKSDFMAPEENNRGTPSQVLKEQPLLMYARKHWTSGERSSTTKWQVEDDLYRKIGRPRPTEGFTRHYLAAKERPAANDWQHACCA